MLVALIVTLGLVGLASFSFWKLNLVKETSLRTERIRVHQLAQAASMELNITRISLQLRHGILARNDSELHQALEDIERKRIAIEDSVASYQSLLYTEQGRALFAKLPVVLEKFWRVGADNVQLIRQGDRDKAFAFLVDNTIPARNEVLAVLSNMVEYQRATLATDIEGVGRSVDATLKAILLLAMGCVLAVFLSSLHVGHVLRRRVQFTGGVVERIRGGDLSLTIEDNARDEFSPLVAALENMQARLNQAVTRVRKGAEFVEKASHAIADDNVDLSVRTEKQTSSLDTTTAATQQLGGTIENNLHQSKDAVSLSNNAVEVAQKGGRVVADVVSTMEGINTSSKRIEEIIGVIDGIAFQTNILALNAAVEAARAGVQGRGFAVVASEVRSLAQRSSHAAHEIKQLISTSVERVSVGTSLVAQAGATMQEIVTSIQKVKDTVGNIHAASEEQHSSLHEVNLAMKGMEHATQENAALVETMSHSANELRKMANELVSTVAYFQTEAGPSGAPIAHVVFTTSRGLSKPDTLGKSMRSASIDGRYSEARSLTLAA